MQLITKELKELMEGYPLYSQENEPDPLIICKFFDPAGSGTWYMTEFDPVEAVGFGYVQGLGGDELGYFSLKEMESIKLPFGLTLERDLYWKAKKLSEVKQ
ncbi:MAG: DUF2958 domain-containing protein [SAR324 cluster bacterium]|nr:DUF2958 domain-containing protein [SAR324 cluster bacterium]